MYMRLLDYRLFTLMSVICPYRKILENMESKRGKEPVLPAKADQS